MMKRRVSKQPLNQKTIAKELEIEEYRLSRVMNRLEAARLIERERSGLDKMVRLAESL